LFTNNNTFKNLQSNMFGSSSIRAKNTGIGATNLWSGTHIRFPDDDIRHFKAMVWASNHDGASRPSREATMALFHAKGLHYVELTSHTPGSISSRRVAQSSKVRVGDIIHMYSGAAGSGVHYQGKVVNPYVSVSHENFLEDFPCGLSLGDVLVHVSPIWRRCQVEWDTETDLTAEWRAILTQPGCGTVIPLKIPSH
jgi:hypothetical protein